MHEGSFQHFTWLYLAVLLHDLTGSHQLIETDEVDIQVEDD